MSEIDEIPLSSAIAEIRRELKIALAGKKDDQISLGVKEIELELTLEIGKRTSGGGGVNVAFLKGDTQAERSGAHRHHIKLILQPGVLNKDTGEVEDMKLSGKKRPAVPHQPGP